MSERTRKEVKTMKEYYCNASFPIGITCVHKIGNICGGGFFCNCKEKSKIPLSKEEETINQAMERIKNNRLMDDIRSGKGLSRLDEKEEKYIGEVNGIPYN